MLTEKEIKERNTLSPAGCSCWFMPIDDKLALKVYPHEYERDLAYERQKKAAEFGLGPDVGQSLEIGEYFCYETEIVAITSYPEYNHRRCPNLSQEYIPEIVECPDYEKQLEELHDDLKFHLDWYFVDDHKHNLGMKNDRLICIDFG